jgi:PAS domain S-box-containing protein
VIPSSSDSSQELRARALEIEQLLGGIADYAIFFLDPTGVVQTWNRGAERFKGYKPEEIIGRHFRVFYTPEDQAAGIPDVALNTARDQGKFEIEAWRVRKDGSRFYAHVVIDAIRDTKGNLVGFAKITRDMTERRALEEQLSQAQKMEAIGQLTGGVAHDFNNLLTVIIGNLDILARERHDVIRRDRALDQAMRGAQRAATLTQQLLAFSRKQPLDPRPCDLNRLVRETVDLVRTTLGERFMLETVLGAGLWSTELDANQFEGVLINLALNARDAMPNGGKITIETANADIDDLYQRKVPDVKPGQYVVVSMTDTGMGMTKDVLDHAFEPFFTTKPLGEGTGLGLSQVYGFVKQSNGVVRLYSEIDRGTTVKLYFPRAKVANEAAAEAPNGSVSGGNEVILIVEDEPAVREFCALMLEDLGYKTITAGNAEEALSALMGHPEVDLIFTDVGLPGLNGRQLAEQARELRPRTPVLFTTGYARNAIVHQGRLDPGVHLLTKPYSREQLARRVRAVLDIPKPFSTDERVIFIAEPDRLGRELVAYILKALGFRVVEALTLANVLALAEHVERIDLLIFDAAFAHAEASALIRTLRSRFPKLPILIASTNLVDLHAYPVGSPIARSAILQKPYTLKNLTAALSEVGLSTVSSET